MNSLFLIVIALALFTLGYTVYGTFIQKRLEVNPEEKTPAETEYDGVDFVPAKNWFILFGHHFSSIAGAAPIIGPVIAVSIWGWGPTVLWIVLGSILIGGLHDFASLVISVKNKGRSIPDIADEIISSRAKHVFALFVFFALILVIAVFAHLCAKTFVTDTRVIFPSVGLIPVAIGVGFLLYRVKCHQGLATLIGIASLIGLIALGYRVPLQMNLFSVNTWLILLLIYSFFASTAPVNILLQPRDYLSAYLLLFGVIAGFLGIVIVRPEINAPVFNSGHAQFGTLWPMLFVTVACGAISGFHSVVASGTTSKQLPSEKDAKKIGYGAMLMEGILSVLALICVSAGLTSFSAFGEIMKTGGPIVAFSTGFGQVTRPLLGTLGPIIGVIILNAFILTTLDTATRIARYLFEEITRIRNRWFSTVIVVALAGFLAWGGRWRALWPIFGASNQLVAALALLVITCWLLSRNKLYLITLVAALFMLVTSIAALVIQIIQYVQAKEILLLILAIALILLALFVLFEVAVVMRRRGRKMS